MEIIIGREAINNRLCVNVGKKKVCIGEQNSVPNNVSRTHCKLFIDEKDNIVLTNLKDENITCVDGQEILTKKIGISARVTLGADHYPVDIKGVIDAAKKLIALDQPMTYSLRPLEDVWNKYEKDLLDMQVANAKRANKQRLQGILSLCATVCAFIESLNTLRFVILALALVCAIYFFWQENKTGGVFAVKKNERDKKFQQDYVCPNPECQCFKGNTAYISLKNSKSCPVCNCKYTC